jgi:hypothetical protein
MLIIGCDHHPSFQQMAFVDTDTGELQTAPGAPRGSREVLPWSWGTGNESTFGNGSQRARALVRATAGGTEL